MWQTDKDDGESTFRHYFTVNQSLGSNCAPSPPRFIVNAVEKKRSLYLSEVAETLGLTQGDIEEIDSRTPEQVMMALRRRLHACPLALHDS